MGRPGNTSWYNARSAIATFVLHRLAITELPPGPIPSSRYTAEYRMDCRTEILSGSTLSGDNSRQAASAGCSITSFVRVSIMEYVLCYLFLPHAHGRRLVRDRCGRLRADRRTPSSRRGVRAVNRAGRHYPRGTGTKASQIENDEVFIFTYAGK